MAISDMLKGSVYSPSGLDISALLKLTKDGKSIEEYGGDVEKGLNAIDTINRYNAEIVCELSYTDILEMHRISK